VWRVPVDDALTMNECVTLPMLRAYCDALAWAREKQLALQTKRARVSIAEQPHHESQWRFITPDRSDESDEC